MSDAEMSYYFNSILTKGRKDNSYKFALARFLIEHANSLDSSYINELTEKNQKQIVPYSIIAKEFLKYYWHQICKYKIRQNFNPGKLPLIVQIIQSIFGTEYIPESFGSMNSEMIHIAENQIASKCFLEVVPRFQNIMEGSNLISKKIFYEHSHKDITIFPQALRFFKENHIFLLKAVILEWARFLEQINNGLPKLISKIERYEVPRSSLGKFKALLSIYFDTCFYCNARLEEGKQLVHVDHFIPWSYLFEDELWNMVLSCQKCNLKKHSSLPSKKYLELLIKRNGQYRSRIEDLQKSLHRLDLDGNQEKSIWKHYQNCMDYGFTQVNL